MNKTKKIISEISECLYCNSPLIVGTDEKKCHLLDNNYYHFYIMEGLYSYIVQFVKDNVVIRFMFYFDEERIILEMQSLETNKTLHTEKYYSFVSLNDMKQTAFSMFDNYLFL